jgi:hypothetical protein
MSKDIEFGIAEEEWRFQRQSSTGIQLVIQM